MNYLSPKYDTQDFYYFHDRNYISEREPKVTQFSDVVLDSNGKIVHSNEFEGVAKETCNTAFYLGTFSTTHFGNMLIDYLSKLWWLPGRDMLCLYNCSKDIAKISYIVDLLKYLDIEAERIKRVEEPIKIANLYVAEPTFVHDKYILPAFYGLYGYIYDKMSVVVPPQSEKIYLTRTRLKRQKEIGEKRFEIFFKANGYEVIALEEYALSQQASIIRHAKTIASIEGTHAHSVVWREGGSGEQIILRKQKEVIPRQMMINQLWGISTTFIDVFEEPFSAFPISHDRGPFLLRWTDQIEQFAQDNNMFVPTQCRKGYWNDLAVYMLKCCYYKIKHLFKHLIAI